MRCGKRQSYVLVGVVSAVMAQAAAAQARDGGVWLALGSGAGVELAANEAGPATAGGAAYVRVGGTPSERLRTAGEIIGWVAPKSGELVFRGNATFDLFVSPFPSSGLFLKGGFGGAAWTTALQGASDGGELGFGATVGVGYDIGLALASGLFLTPNVDLLIQIFDLEPGIERTDNLLLVTVGLTWR